MRTIKELIIHCSATTPEMDVGVKEIRRWHTDPKPKGNGWSDIGYHRVIRRNGEIEPGRDITVPGAHAARGGHNKFSIGVCLVGGCKRVHGVLVTDTNFTDAQWAALRTEVLHFQREFPGIRLLGHRDVDDRKECPTFSVREWALKEKLIKRPDWV